MHTPIKKFENLKIATHYGCHLLRPRQVVRFDNPDAPSKFDELVEATGAESITWPMKLKCCGAPIGGINDDLSMELTAKKIVDAAQSGAQFLCVACSFCQLQLDRVQERILNNGKIKNPIPSVLYTQLLGLSLGIDESVLGLEKNAINVSRIKDFIS